MHSCSELKTMRIKRLVQIIENVFFYSRRSPFIHYESGWYMLHIKEDPSSFNSKTDLVFLSCVYLCCSYHCLSLFPIRQSNPCYGISIIGNPSVQTVMPFLMLPSRASRATWRESFCIKYGFCLIFSSRYLVKNGCDVPLINFVQNNVANIQCLIEMY